MHCRRLKWLQVQLCEQYAACRQCFVNTVLVPRGKSINMAASDEDIAVLAMLLLDDEDEKKSRKNRHCWVRSWILMRNYNQLIPELQATDRKAYTEFMRMDHFHFQLLVNELAPRLYKQDTTMPESIKPAEMCCLT